MYINISKIDFGRCYSGSGGGEEPQLNGLYITPDSDIAISVTPNNSYYTLHGKYLKYSLNGKKWNDWNGSVTIKPEQKMYLKGEDDYVWNSSTSGKLITSDGYYNVGGDISSLTNEIVEVKEYTFKELFLNDSYIKDASNLILASETLAYSCYNSMFNGCTSLTTAPALPATKLANYCYTSMFNGCTSLTTAPALPATKLANYCYTSMFQGCTSLTTAPELPATTLAQGCYSSMFSNCTSLTTAPELPATTLTDSCYFSMFRGCTSLTTAPELPATTLADSCYSFMFKGCTSLTTAPELPATTLADYCYSSMFNGCTSLTTAPELPATTLADSCYGSMFSGCKKLNSIIMLATNISASGCLTKWVDGVAPTGKFTKAASMSSLPTGRSGIPSGWTVVDYTDYMTLSALGDGEITITIPAEIDSSYATSLSYSKDKATWNETIIDNTAQTITIPVTSGENVYLKGIAKQLGKYNSYININSSADINASGNIMSLLYGDDYNGKTSFPEGSEYIFNSLFSGNTHLINAKDLLLPATTLASACYRYMFNGCTSLTTAPVLPATTLSGDCYRYMFNGCSSLTTAPVLPATTLTDYCYHSMFQGCKSLTTAPELPATTLTYGCYGFMFDGCTSLTTAPVLPATTLTFSCYSNMFYGCSNLNSITMLATNISASGCLDQWVYGVSSTGTFTKAASMSSLPKGEDGIPVGWNVVNYGAVDYSQEYMTLSALGDGEITITIPAEIDSSYATSLRYSKDKSNWKETLIDDTEQTITIPVTSGENVYLKGIAKAWYNGDDGEAACINSSANINASGNIMSLLYGDNFKDKTTFSDESNYIFCRLFTNNTHLINAENLILPATTLVNGCYSYMFWRCTSLTTAPELPATKLANDCYSGMFNNCSSLTTAPELPATTLASNCYRQMFIKCSMLNSITMLATDISAWSCLTDWVEKVAPTGTFTKAASMTSLPTGTSGIPSGWTVVDYGAA